MQRLHQDDLVGHVLDRGDWEVLSFPAIAEEDECHVIETVLGTRTFRRKAGEAIHPQRESLDSLRRTREFVGDYTFLSQYQQAPVPKGGAMIKTEWLKYYVSAELPDSFTYTLQSWDTANKSGELNDYSVCTTWGVARGTYYLLDVFRRRLDYPDLKRAVWEQARKYRHPKVLIGDKGSGTQLIRELKREWLPYVRDYQPPAGADKALRLLHRATISNRATCSYPATHLGSTNTVASSLPSPDRSTTIRSTRRRRRSTICRRTTPRRCGKGLHKAVSAWGNATVSYLPGALFPAGYPVKTRSMSSCRRVRRRSAPGSGSVLD